MVKMVWKWFLQGIGLVAPVAVTIALLVWAGTWVEREVGRLVISLLPDGWYFRGLGLLIGVLATIAVGLAANLFLVRWMVRLIERVLDRIPLVKTLVQALKDITRLFSRELGEPVGQVVAVEVGELRLVGFVMQESARLPGSFRDEEDRVAVYLPLSYQIGGYTVHLRRDRVTPLDIPVDQAMRAVLTGGALNAKVEGAGSGNPK